MLARLFDFMVYFRLHAMRAVVACAGSCVAGFAAVVPSLLGVFGRGLFVLSARALLASCLIVDLPSAVFGVVIGLSNKSVSKTPRQ